MCNFEAEAARTSGGTSTAAWKGRPSYKGGFLFSLFTRGGGGSRGFVCEELRTREEVANNGTAWNYFKKVSFDLLLCDLM